MAGKDNERDDVPEGNEPEEKETEPTEEENATESQKIDKFYDVIGPGGTRVKFYDLTDILNKLKRERRERRLEEEEED
jgi:hypothetical protein